MLTVVPPSPKDPNEVLRWEHTRLRRRLLYSCHGEDLRKRIERNAGPVRAAKWGDPDLTANAFVALWGQVAALYNEAPKAHGDEALLEMVEDAGYWPLMQRVQRDTLGLREMHMRLDVVEGRLVVRPVFPDLVECGVRERDPRTPVWLCESVPHGNEWVRLIANVEDPKAPFYLAENTSGQDISEEVIGSPALRGDDYPFRYADGTPFIPYQTYHAAETGRLYDPYTMREVVEGSLNIGMGMTYFWHVTRDAAFSLRYAFGIDIAGAAADGDTGARELVADPAVLLQGSFDPDGSGQPLVGQWAIPVEPAKILDAVLGYERRILLMAGLAPPDVSRQEADVRSGYSLAVQREDIRRQQVVYEPMFRQADLGFLRMAAAMLNRDAGEMKYAEDGYRLEYQGLPASPLEEKARRESLYEDLERGMLAPQDVYMELNPGVSFEEADAALLRNAEQRRRFSA